jgi:hypothetical protein
MTLAKHVFAGVNDTGNACIAIVVDTGDAPVGPLVVLNAFKGTISKKTSHQYILLLNSVHSKFERIIQL